MAITKFIESGSDATQDLSFWSSITGAVASTNAQAHTGPRSINCNTGASPANAIAARTGVLADAGRRISFFVKFGNIPAAAGVFQRIRTSGDLSVYSLTLLSDGTLTQTPTGATSTTGTTVLATNVWYQITISYTITNTTTFRFDVKVNGAQDSSATAGTLTRTGSDKLDLIAGTGFGTSKDVWFDDVYVDDGSDYSYPGNILVTAKRPNANGTTNGFGTQIGAGGSGYGSGHSPQVNEQPLSATNGWSIIAVGSAVTEEYNIENASTGDADITGVSIIDVAGWVYTKALVAETGQIIVNNTSSNIAITTTSTLFLKIVGNTVYPAGAGADIGEITDTTVTTVSLYECGILVAYIQATATTGIMTTRTGWWGDL